MPRHRLATGLPVAATDVGDGRRLIGDVGRLAPPGDPRGLAAAIEAVMMDRDVHAARARRQVARFDAEILAARTAEVLLGALARRGAMREAANGR